MADSQLNVVLLAGRFEVRGTSAYTLRLAEHLADHDVSATIVCADARLVELNKRTKLAIREYPYMSLPVWGRLVMRSLQRDVSLERPNIIHIQSWEMLAEGTWLARRLDCPLVLTAHDYLPMRSRFRFDPSSVQRVIAVSQSVKSELLSRVTLSDEMVTVIHGGVEVSAAPETLPVLDPGHVPVVGTAGPLEAVKGLPFFLGAARRVLAVRKQVEFLISGGGPEEGNLRRLVRELEIADHVTFVPNLPDFAASLAAMDIFCLPSLRQGLGTIMLEAMAMGKPVIASGVGGVYSVVRNNETGLVVSPSDSGELSRRILELLGDPVWARAIGEAGRRTVHEQFGIEQMVRQTVNLYHEVLSR
jgi:glycosyltransferase involved in cell wall biosynthesis